MSAPQHPYRLSTRRQLVAAELEQHVADLVRLLLLTGPGERLHRPDLGAGLGASAIFEPLDGALLGLVEVAARGALEQTLGDRIEVLELAVAPAGESTLEASVTYRVRPGGRATTTAVRVAS